MKLIIKKDENLDAGYKIIQSVDDKTLKFAVGEYKYLKEIKDFNITIFKNNEVSLSVFFDYTTKKEYRILDSFLETIKKFIFELFGININDGYWIFHPKLTFGF